MNATVDRSAVYLVAITNNSSFRSTVRGVVTAAAPASRATENAVLPAPNADNVAGATYSILTRRARAFLENALPDADIKYTEAASFGAAAAELRARVRPLASEQAGPHEWSRGATVLFVIDALSAAPGQDAESRLEATIGFLTEMQRELGFGVSPYSVVVYDRSDDDRVYSHTQCTYRHLPEHDWVLAAEIIQAFTDLIQSRHINDRAMLPSSEAPASLATALTRFLDRQEGAPWGLHFFTGSIVSKLIQDATAIARRNGNPVLRGPSEHSLACGALARCQLHDAPFLLVATSGMASEFKGTLANLRDSQARGFIVIGENEPGTWQPFQGTMHEHENSQAVFRAQGMNCLYLTDARRLEPELAAAFRAYHSGQGPVVLLASPSVLRHTGEVSVPEVSAVRSHPLEHSDTIDTIAQLLNHEPIPIIWQCGKLSDAERELVYQIAHKAGIALVDSLGRPGTVSRHHNGQAVDAYLGTMSLYGCSPEVWELMHPGGRMLGTTEHALFFLKSRVQDLSTPWSERVLREQARIVQVTNNPTHIAPFTDIPVVEDVLSFLRRVAERLDPDPGVVASRRQAIERARRAPRDPLAQVPSIPMSHEYFFTQFNEVLTGLIADHGYDYTGFYDVGRGGISAVRNLDRTRPGFSGWYGRALMGDALLAIPSVALSHPGNILGFIGDGAANLVPSILPALAQQLRYEGGHIDGNVSIFFLLNGGFSIIRSYRELQHAATADAQMSLLTPVAQPWQETWGGVTVTHERIKTVDRDHLAKRLLEPATLNLFSVYLSHDNEGDDIMPLSRKNWRMR